jgi:TRAP-type mannitol/chloroaromatic compound transport system substrate-binding protein
MKKTIRVLVMVILLATLLAGSFGCRSSTTFKWKMATSWTSDSLFYTRGAQAICDKVNRLSGGRLSIEPSPAGKLAGALEVMDAVSQGKVEIGHSWSGYWLEKDRSFELFSSIPNQMVAQEWLIWLYGPSNGIQLWREIYAPYHIVPFPGGLVGPEFGFFTKTPVRRLEDFKGLKLRVSGLASEVLKELGATTVLIPAGDIKSAMQNGQIDGFEFSTPAIDWPMGFQEVAPYVSLPSWHQPSAMNETIVNQAAYDKLPGDLQAILESACKEVSVIDYMAAIEGMNSEFLTKYEQSGTQINTLEPAAVQKISDITNRLADQEAAKNSFYAKVLNSQRSFVADYRRWETWGNYNLYPAQDLADKTLSLVKQQVSAEMASLAKDLGAAAQKLSGIDLKGSEARSLLSGLLKGRPYIVDVSTVDRNATLAAVEPSEFKSFEGGDIGDQEHVIRLFRTQKPVLSWNFQAVEGFDAADMEFPVLSSRQEMTGAVSVLFKPEILLGKIISEAVKNTPYAVWVMQPDGRIVYDVDTPEIGINLFIDPMYQNFPQLVTLGKEISVTQTGAGHYQFLDTGLKQTVNKEARWLTFALYGAEWRLVLIKVID